jgi:hypothetical protein
MTPSLYQTALQGELADMADPEDDEQQALVEEMRAHLKKVRSTGAQAMLPLTLVTIEYI